MAEQELSLHQIGMMNVIVTGASAGIGYELTKKLVADSRITKVVGIARRRERLNQLSDYAESINRSGAFVALDTDITSITFDAISGHIHRADVLINNAGLLINKPFMDLTDEDFRTVYGVNVFAPARLIRLLLPLMGGANTSHVVNIGSMGGVQGSSKFAGLSAYSSSKSALAGLSECLAEELKSANIYVNCLALGAVQTEMLSEAFPGFTAPLTADKMADFVLEFALNGHHYCNGKVLPIASTTP